MTGTIAVALTLGAGPGLSGKPVLTQNSRFFEIVERNGAYAIVRLQAYAAKIGKS